MSKGLWVAIGLIVVAIAWFIGVTILYQPTSSTSAVNNKASIDNTKVMVSLDKFKDFHHDAALLLDKLSVLKTGLESAIDTQDPKLLASTVNNTYRTMDSVSTNRVPTIAPFDVCDEALNNLGVYAVSAKTQYSNANKASLEDIYKLKTAFDTTFAQCQSIVNDKPVEVLYQDYQ